MGNYIVKPKKSVTQISIKCFGAKAKYFCQRNFPMQYNKIIIIELL